MSDYYIKIIPVDENIKVSVDTANKVVKHLESCIIAHSVEVNLYETPEFVDCGAYLEDISCPFCGKRIPPDWWANEMNKAYENDFIKLDIKTPCCDKWTSLNKLKYNLPCGFACVEFDILYPREELKEEDVKKVEKLLGTTVLIIHSRV